MNEGWGKDMTIPTGPVLACWYARKMILFVFTIELLCLKILLLLSSHPRSIHTLSTGYNMFRWSMNSLIIKPSHGLYTIQLRHPTAYTLYSWGIIIMSFAFIWRHRGPVQLRHPKIYTVRHPKVYTVEAPKVCTVEASQGLYSWGIPRPIHLRHPKAYTVETSYGLYFLHRFYRLENHGKV